MTIVSHRAIGDHGYFGRAPSGPWWGREPQPHQGDDFVTASRREMRLGNGPDGPAIGLRHRPGKHRGHMDISRM